MPDRNSDVVGMTSLFLTIQAITAGLVNAGATVSLPMLHRAPDKALTATAETDKKDGPWNFLSYGVRTYSAAGMLKRFASFAVIQTKRSPSQLSEKAISLVSVL